MTDKIASESAPIFEMTLGVRDYEVDSQGIVNNAHYLHYFEHTRHEFCRLAGTSFRAMQAEGLDPVLRRAEVDYLTPLRLGDEMLSRLWFFRQGPRFVFRQEILRLPEREVCAVGMITIVCLENGRMSRGDRMAEYFSRFLQ